MGTLENLIDAHGVRRTELDDRIQRLVEAEFARFGGWYSPRMVASVVSDVAERVAYGQIAMAQLTDAHLSQVASYVSNRYIVGGTVPATMGQTLRRGVTNHEEVYTRVAAEFRRQRSLGATEPEALNAALARARAMVSTDMGLAFQHQSRQFMRERRISYYRRVLRPELSKGGSCGLCVAASDRIYKRETLLPIHARCKCTVIQVTANTDPGTQLNDDTLAELYGAAGPDGKPSTAGPDLKRVRVKVFDHPELGPQLRVQGHNVRDLSEAAA